MKLECCSFTIEVPFKGAGGGHIYGLDLIGWCCECGM